jgi:hypothetical protein
MYSADIYLSPFGKVRNYHFQPIKGQNDQKERYKNVQFISDFEQNLSWD